MKKQIDGIREYFKGLTVSLNNIVLMVKFPDGWILGLSDGLLKDFKCEVRSMQDGVYFIDQFENGYEEIFKCANTIISVNNKTHIPWPIHCVKYHIKWCNTKVW